MGWILGFCAMASLGLPGPRRLLGRVPGDPVGVPARRPVSREPLFRFYMVIAAIGTVLAAGYLLWMLQKVAFGEPKPEFADAHIHDVSSFRVDDVDPDPAAHRGARHLPEHHLPRHRPGRHAHDRTRIASARSHDREPLTCSPRSPPPRSRTRSSTGTRSRPTSSSSRRSSSCCVADLVAARPRGVADVAHRRRSACSPRSIPIATLAADGHDRSMFGGAYVVDHYALALEGVLPRRHATSRSCCRSTTSARATTTRASTTSCCSRRRSA